MQKILSLLGLGDIKYSFSDFESKLRSRYIRNFILDFILAVFCIIFLFTTKYYRGTIIFILALILLLLFHVYSVLQLLCGNVYCFEGKVISDDKIQYKEKIFSLQLTILGTSKIKVSHKGNIYYVPVGHNMRFEPDSVARIYFYPSNTAEVSENEYDILNPILVTKVIETE